MPLFSAFNPFGQFAFSSAPSLVEIFYDMLPALWGTQHDMTNVGTYEEAKRYAVARMLALATVEQQHAGNQANPLTAWDLLPLLENDYLITPGPKDGIVDRQNAVAAAMLLPGGAKSSNVVNALKATLGATMLAYVPNPAGTKALAVNPLASGSTGWQNVSAPTVYPASPGAGPGAFKSVQQPARFIRLVDPVATLGPSWVAYEALDPTTLPTITWSPGAAFSIGQVALPTLAGATGLFYACTIAGSTGTAEPAWPTIVGGTVIDGTVTWTCVSTVAPMLAPGDVLVMEPGNTSQMEQVEVLAVANTLPVAFDCTPGPTYMYFQAAFTKSHDVGAVGTTGHVPYWWSTQRLNLVVVAAAAAVDPVQRAKVDRLMGKILRFMDQWATVQPSSTTAGGGTIGPLSAGMGMGTTTIGVIPYTNSN